MKIHQELEELTNEKLSYCLQKYINNYDFIKWLRETATSKKIFFLYISLKIKITNKNMIFIIKKRWKI
jgi:hypothetical protein